MTPQHIVPLASLLLLASCHNGGNPSSSNAPKANADNAAQGASKNIIEKNIAIDSEFSYITNLGSVKIIYMPGDYSITAKADSTTFKHLDIRFDSNLLTVNLKHDSNADYNIYGNTTDVTLYVSCPHLECISTCGNGSFESKGIWKTDSLQVGVMGTGGIKIDTLMCRNLAISSTSTGNIDIKHMEGDNASILSRSSATITADVSLKSLNIYNMGTQTTVISGHTNELHVAVPKDVNLNLSKLSSLN